MKKTTSIMSLGLGFSLLVAPASLDAAAAGSISGSGVAWCAEQTALHINARYDNQRPDHDEYLDVGGPLWVRTLLYDGHHQDIANLYTEYYGKVKILVIMNHESFNLTMPDPNGDLWEWYDYAQFFADKAVIFAQSFGYLVAAYEIWNEPDMPGGGDPIPPEYMALVMGQTVTNLRQIGVTKPIITGGVVGPNWPSYLQDLYYYLGSNVALISGVGFHPYTKTIDGFPPGSGTGEMDDAIFTASALAYNKPVWITEFGLQENPSSPDWQRQAEYLDRAYDLFKQLGPQLVPHAFWFAWDDRTHYDPSHEAFGLVDAFHFLRPSGWTFRGKVRAAEASLPCSTWDGDRDACDAHAYGTTQDCAYYNCSDACRARGTSNCQAGCPQYCNGTDADLPCSTWDGDRDACDAHGWGTTQDCAYYNCSGACRARGTSNCQAGCLSYCCQ